MSEEFWNRLIAFEEKLKTPGYYWILDVIRSRAFLYFGLGLWLFQVIGPPILNWLDKRYG